MENYIVRIYRRDAEDPMKLAGLVEIVGKEENKAFQSFEELREILQDPGEKRGQIQKKQSKRKGETGHENF